MNALTGIRSHWSAIARCAKAIGPFMACVLACVHADRAHAQLVLSQTQSPSTLVNNVLVGPNVFASTVLFNGFPGSTLPPGEDATRIARFNGTNCSVGLPGGIVLNTGDATFLLGPNDNYNNANLPSGGFPFNATPDADISRISGSVVNGIYNKSVLEFDFIPLFDMLSFRYVMTSEEYEIWACSQYNDAFGFFLSGPGISGPYTNNAMNIALVPNSLSRVSINSINSGPTSNNANGPVTDPFAGCFATDPNWQANTAYYVYNGTGLPVETPYCCDPYYIAHNGRTVVLTASAAVQCGQQYHIKLAIGNVNDFYFPSAVFLEQGSFTSSDRFGLDVRPGPNVEMTATDTTFIESECDSVYLQLHRYGGFYLDEDVAIEVGGTATPGTDYAAPIPVSVHFDQLDTMVTIPIAVPVDVDGTEDLVITIVTCDGAKRQTYTYIIDQKPPLVVQLDDITGDCDGTYTLTPTVTGGSGDPSNYTYLWNTGETTPSIEVDVPVTTQFWVTVRDSCWTFPVTDSAWVTMPVYPPLTLTMSPDVAIPCPENDNVSVTAAGGDGDYTYSWTLNGAPQSTDASLEVPYPTTAVYYVVEVADGCHALEKDSVLVSPQAPDPIVLVMTPDTDIACLGHADISVIASGGGGDLSYAWTHNGDPAGDTPTINVPAAVSTTYVVEVTDECGQTATGSVNVSTGPTPPIHIVAEGDTVMCANIPVVLSVLSVSGGGGNYHYDWSVPPDTGGNDGPTVQLTIPDDAFYTVTVTDDCGNTSDTTLAAVVTDHDPLVITLPDDTTVCPGENVPLWVLVSGGAGGYQVTWPGLGTGSPINWNARPGGITANVQITDACGETISGAVEVGVHEAGLRIAAEQVIEGTWFFQAMTTPATGNTLHWDLGDGTESDDQEVTHSYNDYEVRWVVLTMVTPDGCVLVDSVMTAPPSGTIYFPNSFTPDGDGLNETFGGVGRLIDTYELLIFDRWGSLIFESHEIGHRWDGSVRGSDGPVKTEVYSYRYRVKLLDEPTKQGFGHVTLLR